MSTVVAVGFSDFYPICTGPHTCSCSYGRQAGQNLQWYNSAIVQTRLVDMNSLQSGLSSCLRATVHGYLLRASCEGPSPKRALRPSPHSRAVPLAPVCHVRCPPCARPERTPDNDVGLIRDVYSRRHWPYCGNDEGSGSGVLEL